MLEWKSGEFGSIDMRIALGTALLAVLGGGLIGHYANAEEAPIPRLWLQDIQQQSFERNCTLVGILRGQPLVSEDGRWEVYSRVTYKITPVGFGRLSSALFVRDRQTQSLETIYAPASIFRQDDDLGLDFLFLLPIEWRNDRVLVREFSGLFRSQAILNQAIVWHPPTDSSPARLHIETPQPDVPATVLLGWDPQSESNRILFAISDFSGPPQVVAVGDRETRTVNYVPAPDWLAISDSVNLEREVSDAELEAEITMWESGWPALTGQLCSPPEGY